MPVFVLARRELDLRVVVDVRRLEKLLDLPVEFLDRELVQVVDNGHAAVLFELGEFRGCEWHVGVCLFLFPAVRCVPDNADVAVATDKAISQSPRATKQGVALLYTLSAPARPTDIS